MTEKTRLHIRKASKADLGEVSEIFYKESSKKPYLQEWAQENTLEKIKELFKKGDIYVATEIKALLGFVACHKICEGKGVFIDEFWIKSVHQRKGIGKALLVFIEDVYRKKGLKSIKLVSDKKSGAFYFYKKLGYMEKNQYALMVKKLGK